MHKRNKHQSEYNFTELIKVHYDLSAFVIKNKYDNLSIDFSNSDAVKCLNNALLNYFYNIKFWDIPKNYLCPPIPGRADYIHSLADILALDNNGKIPITKNVKCLDIGVGANCIYPIIGNSEYGWEFIGSDIDDLALKNAYLIINNNPSLKGNIELRRQTSEDKIFKNIIRSDEFIDVSISNPPFHASAEEAININKRKVKNLKIDKSSKSSLNFGGQSNELWCEGGEIAFIRKMIFESKDFNKNVLWFTSLVSKESNLKQIYSLLAKTKVTDINTLEMGQGNKKSRIVAWTFLNVEQRQKWAKIKW